MATREILAIYRDTPSSGLSTGKAAQAGDTYLLSQDMEGNNKSITDLNGLSAENPTGNVAKSRYWYKTNQTTPGLIVGTGISNVLGDDTAVVPFDDNPNVYVFQITTPAASPVAPTLVNPANFSFQNVSASTAATSYLHIGGGSPYVGYRNGGYANAVVAFANREQERTGRDQYVLLVTCGGQHHDLWAAGAGGYCRIVLENFMAYILNAANVPALADVTAPDVVISGISEASTGDAPLLFASEMVAIRNAAHGLWSDNKITQWLAMEFTDAWQESIGGWEGLRAWSRLSDDKLRIVSAAGLADKGDLAHFDGDDLNEYGYRMSDANHAAYHTKDIPSTQIQLDKNPILGGNLDCNDKQLLNITRIVNEGGYVAPSRVLAITTADASVLTTDSLILTGGVLTADRNLNLPALSTCVGQVFTIQCLSGTTAFSLILNPDASEIFINPTVFTIRLAIGELISIQATSGYWVVLSRSLPSAAWTAKNTTSTLHSGERLITCTNAGAMTITLPPAAHCINPTPVTIKNLGAGNVSVDQNGAETIDGSAAVRTLTTNQCGVYSSNGTTWYKISEG